MMTLPSWLLWLLCAMVLLKLYLWLRMGRCRSRRRLDGKTVLVTGANAGIGKEAALDFARRGARVILGCRDERRATEARDYIVKSTGNQQVEVRLLDLGSLRSVREFAEGFLASEDRLDILVNNAGVAGLKNQKTADGLDLTMQINHFGPFLLTNLLLDLLKKSAPSRIVMVSSCLHKSVELELDNLNFDRPAGPIHVYSVSKLCNVMMAKELCKRLEKTGVTANSLHPGAVQTDAFRKLSGWRLALLRAVSSIYFKDSEQGAQTTIYVAVSIELDGVSGKYFEDCRKVNSVSLVKDPWVIRKLWELSEAAVGLSSETTPLL